MDKVSEGEEEIQACVTVTRLCLCIDTLHKHLSHRNRLKLGPTAAECPTETVCELQLGSAVFLDQPMHPCVSE